MARTSEADWFAVYSLTFFCPLAAGLSGACAQVVLTIDDSNPTAVTFTGTGEFSEFHMAVVASFPIQLSCSTPRIRAC
jgi:hypothetical protein